MSHEPNTSLSQIGQISVNVHDLARAAVFYKETLGLKHLFTVPPKMAFFDCGGIRLMIAIPERPDLDHPSSILYFKVADIERAHKVLASLGVHFETKPTLVAPMATHNLWLAEFSRLGKQRPRAHVRKTQSGEKLNARFDEEEEFPNIPLRCRGAILRRRNNPADLSA